MNRLAELARAADLARGDVITETDTPAGPWYTVVAMTADTLTIDGTSPDKDADPILITLGIAADAYVLRRPR